MKRWQKRACLLVIVAWFAYSSVSIGVFIALDITQPPEWWMVSFLGPMLAGGAWALLWMGADIFREVWDS